MERKPKIDGDPYVLLDDLLSREIKDGNTQPPPYVNISLSYLKEGIKLHNLGLQTKDLKSRQRIDRLIDAQECFKKSLDVVISTLKSNSVGTKDQFMAWKLYLAATTLKSRSIEDPETAVTYCLSELDELSNLPLIKRIFSKCINYLEITALFSDPCHPTISSESTNNRTWPSVGKRPFFPSNQIFARG